VALSPVGAAFGRVTFVCGIQVSVLANVAAAEALYSQVLICRAEGVFARALLPGALYVVQRA
jgi:hypothetical protein